MTTQVEHPVETITLNVQGMTCAACVVHVEAALKSVSGVLEASVNLATDQARVEYLDGLTGFDSLCEAVADAGYSVEGIASEMDVEAEQQRLARTQEIASLTRKVGLAGLAGIVIMALMYVPLETLRLSAFQLNVLLWAMATPVQFWAGAVFYRSAWGAIKHRTANMNTLVAVGHHCRLCIQHGADLLRRLFQRSPPSPRQLRLQSQHRSLFRRVGHDHRPRPAGTAAGGPRQGADLRRHPQIAGVPACLGQGGPQRRSGRGANCPSGDGRHGGCPPGREAAGGRGNNRWGFSDRRVHAHRGKPSGGEDCRGNGVRWHGQYHRELPVHRHQGGPRDSFGPDHPHGGRGARFESAHTTVGGRRRQLLRSRCHSRRGGGMGDLVFSSGRNPRWR